MTLVSAAVPTAVLSRWRASTLHHFCSPVVVVIVVVVAAVVIWQKTFTL